MEVSFMRRFKKELIFIKLLNKRKKKSKKYSLYLLLRKNNY